MSTRSAASDKEEKKMTCKECPDNYACAAYQNAADKEDAVCCSNVSEK